MHTPDTAARTILAAVEPLDAETLPLGDALDRVLAGDVASPIDLPHWPNSAMDGYALRRADLAAGPPAELAVVERIAAGAFPTRALGPGECARIFTGAPVPDGADTVIRQEDTTPLGDDRVRIDDDRDAGRNIRPAAEDVRRGELVLRRGAVLGPAQLGVLASLACRDVPVYRRPVVAVLATGDEIADLDEREAILAGRKIASSNSYTLAASIVAAGGRPVALGIAGDDPGDIRARLERGRDADLIVTSAGVSVGEHDFLHEVLDGLELRNNFWRIRMRPGAPVGFGRIGAFGGVPWFGLPGNPVSTMVTFELFVRPAIRRMAGHRKAFRRAVPVRVGERIALGPPLRHFLRVSLTTPRTDLDGDAQPLPVAALTGPQGSGLLTSMAKADALLVVPEDKPVVESGEILTAIVLDDPRHVEEVPF